MKPIFSSLFFFLSLAFLLTVALAADGQDEYNVGVRLSLQKEFDPTAYCLAEERMTIRSAIHGALDLPARRLRDSRQLSQCVELCDESAPGHCFLGHRECQGWRRLEETSAVGGSLAQDFVDPNPDAEILEDVSKGRFLISKRMVITPEMRERCQTACDSVVTSLMDLNGLNAPCKRLLRKPVDVECFIL